MTSPSAPVPIILLSGCPGSGKSTLLSHLLTGMDRRRVVVIECDLSESCIDHDLLFRIDLAQLDATPGSTGCLDRELFIRLMHVLAAARANVDRVIIETSGVAHPKAIVDAVLRDPVLSQQLVMHAVITVVDAHRIAKELDDGETARGQIVFANALVINKIDLVTPDALGALADRLRQMNPTARQYAMIKARVPVVEILALG